MVNETQNTCCREVSVLSELEEKQDLYCINRDGDLHYVECPECYSTDLKKPHLFLCRNCGINFDVSKEDGVKRLAYIKVNYSIKKGKPKLKIIVDKRGRYYLPFERQVEQLIEELGEEYDKTILVSKDLRENGKDAHGHAKYQKYLVIKI